jgi:hypothetical protein
MASKALKLRLGLCCSAVCALSGIAFSQDAVARSTPAQRDVRRTEQLATAVIRGSVFDADTRRPLGRATITGVASALSGERHIISTDSDGQFELRNLPPGRYVLSISRAGYLSTKYGQHHPFEPGEPIDVVDGAVINGISVALLRAGGINGRVSDETGEPMVGARVWALRRSYVGGVRWASAGTVTTNDVGEYTLPDLTPGTYIVMAMSLERWSVAEVAQVRTFAYAQTYFPGTTDITAARRIEMRAGQEVTDADVALMPGRTARISGLASDSRGQPISTVMLVQEILGPAGGATRSIGSASVATDRSFMFSDVAPGEYYLIGSNSREVARVVVVVDGSDIDNIVLTSSRGAAITGQISPASNRPLAMERVSVTAASLSSPKGVAIGGVVEGQSRVLPNGTFRVTTILGPIRLQVNLPQGWIVQSIRQGERDLMGTILDVRLGETLSDVQVIVSDRPAGLEGVLSDSNGAPVSEGTVVVFSSDSRKWFENSWFVTAAQVDKRGRFRVSGLVPGEYFAVGLSYVEVGAWNDREFLETLRSRAQTVTLAEDEARAVELRLMP